MKASVRNFEIFIVPLFSMLLAAMILFVACGGSGGESESTATTGGIRVNLLWEDPQTSGLSLARQTESRDVCEYYGIETVAADVVDAAGDLVGSVSWPCSDHQGTIENVPAGMVAVDVKGYVSNRIDWRAQIDDVEIKPGEITETPKVLMQYIGDDQTPPEIERGYPSGGAEKIPLDVIIRIDFSEPIVLSTINSANFILSNEDDGQTVPTRLDYDENQGLPLLRMTPLQPLADSRAYRVTVSAEIEDFAGNNMNEERSWTFTTVTAETWYKDNDGDGFSDGILISSVERPSETFYLEADLTAVSGDCNDDDATVHPNAEETCSDTIDKNCDGIVLVCREWFKDADGDKYADDEVVVAPERPGDGYYLAEALQQTYGDCNDQDPLVNPGAEEICDDKDNDCDGEVLVCLEWFKDADGDGYSDNTMILAPGRPSDQYFLVGQLTASSGDCNDNDASIYTGNDEVCDGKDNDCNPSTEDGSGEAWFGAVCDGNDSDLCQEGFLECSDGAMLCSDNSSDTIEFYCDGVDQDCDGTDLCFAEVFDFEEFSPTYVDDGNPRSGKLTILQVESTENSITIIREEGGEDGMRFDLVDNQAGIQVGKPAAFREVSLDPYYAEGISTAFIVNFTSPVSNVQVDMGDYNTIIEVISADDDILLLEAYSMSDASGELLDRDQVNLLDTPAEGPTFSFETLFVAAPVGTCIQSIRMIGGSTNYPHSVFYDNIIVRPCGLAR